MPTFDFVHDLSDKLAKKKIAHLVISFSRKKDDCSANIYTGAIDETSAVVMMEALKNVVSQLEINGKDPDYIEKYEDISSIICGQGIEYVIFYVKRYLDNYNVNYRFHLRDKKGVEVAQGIINKIVDQYQGNKKFPKKKKL